MKLVKMILAALLFFVLGPMKAQQTNVTLEEEAVLAVLKTYKSALENKSTEGTFELFAPDSQVFEQGGSEGTYADYIEHHLGPELAHFSRLEFSDYAVEVELALPFAFTTESYSYLIELEDEKDESPRIIQRKGIATSVLKKSDGKWKIVKMHSSSRNNN